MVSERFLELVLEERPAPKMLCRQVPKMSDHFVYRVFADESRSDADVRYLQSLLNDWQLSSMDVILRLRVGWKEETEKVCTNIFRSTPT